MKPIESERINLDRKIVLSFPHFDGFVTEYAANLSMTGLFVRSKEPQAAGTPVSFELRLEGGAPLVRGNGWVVWSRPRRDGPDRPAGMGIEFTRLDQESRRLVRWLILSQLPEGAESFDVHAGTADAPGTVRLLSQSALRRRRRAGVLTAVAMFVALAALVYWGGLHSGGHDAEVDPAAGGFGQKADVGLEPAGAGAVTGRPSEALSDGSAEAAALAAVENVVRRWAAAWSSQDAERYLSLYAPSFEPDEGLTKEQWVELRRRRVTAPKGIRVSVTRLEPRLLSEAEARVSFLQTYRSEGYADTVDKVLFLMRDEGKWKISREVTD